MPANKYNGGQVPTRGACAQRRVGIFDVRARKALGPELTDSTFTPKKSAEHGERKSARVDHPVICYVLLDSTSWAGARSARHPLHSGTQAEEDAKKGRRRALLKLFVTAAAAITHPRR